MSDSGISCVSDYRLLIYMVSEDSISREIRGANGGYFSSGRIVYGLRDLWGKLFVTVIKQQVTIFFKPCRFT